MPYSAVDCPVFNANQVVVRHLPVYLLVDREHTDTYAAECLSRDSVVTLLLQVKKP
jgi:hypothetical protein